MLCWCMLHASDARCGNHSQINNFKYGSLKEIYKVMLANEITLSFVEAAVVSSFPSVMSSLGACMLQLGQEPKGDQRVHMASRLGQWDLGQGLAV